MRRALRWLRHAWHRDLIWRLDVLEAQSHVTLGALAKARVEMVELRRELFKLHGAFAELRTLLQVIHLASQNGREELVEVSHGNRQAH